MARHVISDETYVLRTKLAPFCQCITALSQETRSAVDVFLSVELNISPVKFWSAITDLCLCCGAPAVPCGPGGCQPPGPQPQPGEPAPEPEPAPGPGPAEPEPPFQVPECVKRVIAKLCALGPDSLKAVLAAMIAAATLISDPAVRAAAMAVVALFKRLITLCSDPQRDEHISALDVRGFCVAAAKVDKATESSNMAALLAAGNVGVLLQELLACCADPAIAQAPLPPWMPSP